MHCLITYDVKAFVIGLVVSFVSGLLCIRFLLNYVKKHDYDIFMWYRLIMALIVLLVLFFKQLEQASCNEESQKNEF